MNNQEARLILQAYRPDGQDASDPLFAEALEQVRRDPELQKWFAQQNSLDVRVQALLEVAIPVPRRLKSDLLALQKISRPSPWWPGWFHPMKLAAAATVVLLLGLAALFLFPQKQAQLASFQATMAHFSAQEQEHVTFESHDLAKIQQWLQGQGAETKFELPTVLRRGIPQGCRLVNWNGHEATMVCFMLDNGEHMDLFVMDHADLPDFPENGAPQYAKADGLMTAAWADGGKIYLLTGRNRMVLQKIFQNA